MSILKREGIDRAHPEQGQRGIEFKLLNMFYFSALKATKETEQAQI